MFRWILVPLILMTTLTVAGGNQGPGAGQNEAVLAELQQALAKAWVSGDRATIERIIAPEWRSIGPDGRTTDRAKVLADVFEKRVHRIRRIEIDDVNAHVFGDAAVVTGRTHGVGDVQGAAYDVVIRDAAAGAARRPPPRKPRRPSISPATGRLSSPGTGGSA